MELQQLQYFRAVADHLHFSRAAEALSTAQPHVSREIKRLEQELGAELFTRTTRRVALTQAGAALYDRTGVIFDELTRAAQVVRSVHEGSSGHVSVGFAGSTTYSWLPFLVKAYRQEFPGVELQIHTEMFTGEQVEALLDNQLDLGLLRPPFEADGVDSLEISSEPLILALPGDHALAGSEEPIHLERLRSERFVTYGGQGSVTQVAVLGACVRAGFVPTTVQTVFETHSVISLVSAGLGVALVPHSARHFTMQGVVFRPVADSTLELPLALAWRRATTNAAAMNFVQLARSLRDSPLAPRPA
ncbi:LysR family transcriptional regulator [Occultella gossypii]|uniref:LysR family transcriptional regulator n=1 Tax=Occultella gossypii TaxID=2800820 RepID=A0ABS7S565_9MICO|nr:LysR family transcriptional regulator [Occultella gossypii]MBZ2195427.1 LysR family transcriptional regulator [Occultella gossypii]